MKFKERDTSKPAEQQGIFRKFQVSRVDGSDVVGGKHFGCRYFVLDMDHDAHAPAALRAYADSCASTHPELAADLRREFGEAERTTSPVATTPSTASQAPAVSIDTPEFRELLKKYHRSTTWDTKLIAHIDAKLAQEREEAIGTLAIAFEKMLCAAVGRDWSPSGISASSLVEELRSRTEKAESRATAAEAKLEAIRAAVDAAKVMTGEEIHKHLEWTIDFDMNDAQFIRLSYVLALLQPQPQQSGTDGLPG